MSARPLVSILVPTRDRAPRVVRTVRSALAQEGQAVEVVVVDDGSTDGTAEVLNDISGSVRVVRHETPAGVARARNAGIEAARGEWVAFLDDDDLWSPLKVARQLEVATGAGASWVYGDVITVDREQGSFLERAAPGEEVLDLLLRGDDVPAGASNVMARTDVVRSVGGFDERLAHLADRDLWIRLAVRSRPAVCSDALVAYIQHDDNMHLDPDSAGIWREVVYLAEKHRGLQSAGQRAEAERALLRWMLASQKRAGRRDLAVRTELRLAVRERNVRRVGSAARVVLNRPPRPAGPQSDVPEWAR